MIVASGISNRMAIEVTVADVVARAALIRLWPKSWANRVKARMSSQSSRL